MVDFTDQAMDPGYVRDRLIELIDDMSEYHRVALLELLEKNQLKMRRRHKRRDSRIIVDCLSEGISSWDYIHNISIAAEKLP